MNMHDAVSLIAQVNASLANVEEQFAEAFESSMQLTYVDHIVGLDGIGLRVVNRELGMERDKIAHDHESARAWDAAVELSRLAAQDHFKHRMLIAISFGRRFMKMARESVDAGNWPDVVKFLHGASSYAGMAGAYASPNGALEKLAQEYAHIMISDRARAAANSAHKENREIKKIAFEWLDDHFAHDGLTNDGAAEKLGSVVPSAFSTRLAYVKEWKKSR